MKTKKLLPILIIAVLAIFASVALVIVLGRANYELVVDGTDKVALTKEGFVVEADTSVSIPNGVVYDRSGNYCSDFTVKRTIVDENGAVKASTLQMKHGQVYTVTYVADNGAEQLKKEVKLKCYDTTIPTISFLNLQKTYNVNDEIIIKVKDISSDIDYKASKIKLVNKKTKKETKLNFKEDYKFIADKAEQYSLVVSLKDVNDNENEQIYNFRVTKKFKDVNISKNNIWDFDEKDYINNVLLLGQSDDMEFDIITEKLPKDKDNIGIEGGALNISFKANESYDFKLSDGNAVQVKECSTVGFNIWTDEVIDIFEVYNIEDGSMVDLSWKVAKRDRWQKIEFNPAELFNEDVMLDSLRIVMSCEEDVRVYIDSVYYTDYVEPWRDEDIPKDVLALFDDARYMERVLKLPGGDATTFGARWEYVTKINGTTDFTGGAIKLVSTTDANLESGGSREGFQFQLFDRLAASQMEGLLFRIYCEDPSAMISVSVVDKKMGNSPEIWASISGSTGNWVNVLIDKEYIQSYWDGYENITHLNLRFIRPKGTQIQGKEEYVAYIDSISLYELDYRKVAYTFKNEYDMRVVNGVGDAVPTRVADAEASDGWTVKAKTVYSQKNSGLLIAFNTLDLSKYAHIYMHVKTTDAISLYLNDTFVEYRKYDKYTKVDLMPYLEKIGAKSLISLNAGRTHVAGIDVFIDGITFVTKEEAYVDYNKVKYSFDNDYDMKAISSLRDAEITKVQDKDANDGWAAKAVTALDFEKESGMQISFDNLDLSKYAHIYMRLKTSKDVGIYWNGKCIEWKTFAKYTQIDLLDYAEKAGATVLDNISISRKALGGIEIYVDEIILVTKEEAKVDYGKVKYTFVDDYDMKAIESLAGAEVKKAKDTDANDGMAAKAVTALDFERESGMQISFDNLDLSKYAHIYMRLKTSKDVGIFWNGKCVEWKTFGKYTQIDLLDYAEQAGATKLDSISITRKALGGIEIYVDEIVLVTKEEATIDYSKVKYTFVDDYDMKVVEGLAGAEVKKVEDTDAYEHSAVKATTALDFEKVSGMQISFNNIDISQYAHIYMRLKTTKEVDVYINGDYVDWKKFDGYQEVDLIAYAEKAGATHLQTVTLGRQSVGGIEIYVDRIRFEDSIDFGAVEYKFANEKDMSVVNAMSSAQIERKSDSNATDGYSLYCKTAAANDSGVRILFNNIDISNYSHIYMKLRTTDYVNIAVNDTYKDYKKLDDYTQIDLLAYAGDMTTLQSVSVYRSLSPLEVFIDEIIFVEKNNEGGIGTDEPYDFDQEADFSVVSAYHSGTFSLADDSAAKDGKALKVTTGTDFNNVSGAQISLGSLNVSEYETIKIRLRSTDIIDVYLNGTTSIIWQKYDRYTEIDLKEYATTKGLSTLTSVEVGRKSKGNIDVYVDEIIIVKKDSTETQYDFDKEADLSVVSVYYGGTFSVMDDSAAKDGKALKVTTSLDFNNVSGVQINLGNLNVSEYETIKIRLRSTDIIDVFLNGTTSIIWQKYDTYTEIDLKEYATTKGLSTLTSVEVGRKSKGNIDVYVDEIIIVKKDSAETPYDFDKEADLSVVSAYHGGTFSVMNDSAAKDGKALKVTTSLDFNNVSGAQISLGSLNVSEYETIKIRLQSTDIIDVYLNGTTSIIWQKYDTYTEIDLKEYATTKGLSTLTSVEVGRKSKGNIDVYVDEIIVVKK